jgi:hypothetical protein
MLAATILLEYRGGANDAGALSPNLPAPSHPASVSRNPSPAVQPGGVSAAMLEGWVRTILDRPLFSPSRRPGQVAVASTELPRLAGIIIGPDGARAIFASSGGARAIVAGAGAHAGPYLIRAVDPTGVSVIGPNGPELLHPAYDRNAVRGSAAPGYQAPGSGSGQGSILDLLRARAQNGDGLRPPLPASPPQRLPGPQR